MKSINQIVILLCSIIMIDFVSCDEDKKDQSITFGSIPNKQLSERSFELDATATSGLNVEFESSNPLIASISDRNVVTMHQIGQVNITAFQDGDGTYNTAAPVIQSLTIVSPGVVLLKSWIFSTGTHNYAYKNDTIVVDEYTYTNQAGRQIIDLTNLIYNSAGELKEERILHSYDQANPTITSITKSGNVITYGSEILTLDAQERLFSVVSDNATKSFSYDPNGNLSTVTVISNGSTTDTYTYSDYDQNKNPYSQSVPQWWLTYKYEPSKNELSHINSPNNPGKMIHEISGGTSTTYNFGYTYNSDSYLTSRAITGSATSTDTFSYY